MYNIFYIFIFQRYIQFLFIISYFYEIYNFIFF